MKELPMSAMLLVCDQIITDAETGKKSLIGLFSNITASSLPFRRSLSAFVILGNGQGQGEFEFVGMHEPSGQPLFRIHDRLTFRAPTEVFELAFNLNDLTFEQPGPYSFEFRFDGELLLERRITVTLSPSRQR
jgi:hypothetical protein